MTNLTSVGERIKSIRRHHNLTQIEFAQSLEISQGTLSEIESGKAKPSFDVLVRLADKYMVDMNWLIMNQQADLNIVLQENERTLLHNFRNLEDIAKEELLDYSKLKLLRFRKTEGSEIMSNSKGETK